MTVEEVIQEILKTYAAMTKDDINKVVLNSDSQAYILKFAEEDGTPEEDMPGFSRNILFY